MGHLYKPTVTRHVDPAGRLCAAATPGAVKRRAKARKWYGKFRDAAGTLRSVPLSPSKSAAKLMLAELEKAAAEGAAGLNVGLAAASRRPLAEHCDDFRKSLAAGGRGARHISGTLARLRNLADGCGWTRLHDLDPDRLESWLADRRDAGDFGATTANGYLTAWRNFCRWAMRAGRLSADPLAKARKVKTGDAAIERRAAAADELARLLAAADAGETFRGMSGPDRAALYLAAVETGFRVGELASLTAGSLDLAAHPPAIRLAASAAKSGVAAEQPIRPATAATLAAWLRSKAAPAGGVVRLPDPAAPLWPGTWRERAADMLRRDLAAARSVWLAEAPSPAERERRERSDFLTAENARGERLDFHALRATYCTRLLRAGVEMKTAQLLMRHAAITTTAQHYAKLTVLDLAAGLDRLAPLPDPAAARRQATGTDGPTDPAGGIGCGETTAGRSRTGDRGAKDAADGPKSVAPIVALPAAVSCGSERFAAEPAPPEGGAAAIRIPFRNAGEAASCGSPRSPAETGAGGTRTRNQRIMSPLL